MRLAAGSGAWLLLASLLAATLACSAGDETAVPSPATQPPTPGGIEGVVVTLDISGRPGIPGRLGTYCWAANDTMKCADSPGPVTSADALPLPPGSTLALRVAGASPGKLFVRWFAASDLAIEPRLAGAAGTTWQAPDPENAISTELKTPAVAGRYILTLQANLDGPGGRGDGHYAWYLEVK